jgi:hypothetical protein
MTTGLRRDQQRGFELRPIEATGLGTSVYGLVGDLSAIDPDDAAAAGTSARLAHADHQHAATAGAPDALTKTATSAENNGASFARNNHTHATSALPWGHVDRIAFTADSTGYSTGATTDFSRTITADNTRAYVVHLAAQITVSVAGGAWSAELNEAGTAVGRFFRYVFAAGVSETPPSHPVLWLPAASGSVTLDVRLTGAGGGTLTFIGATTNPRQFWIEDIGPR